MQNLISTGEAARLLGVTEPQLNGLVRRARISPQPPLVAGRRLWNESLLRKAAVAFGREADLFGESAGESAGKGAHHA